MVLPYVWWRRIGIKYEVTEKRVIRHTGRISSSTDEFQLDQVSRVRTSQSVGDKLFGTGSITVDTGVDEMTLKAVPNYKRVADTIRKHIN